VVPLFGLWWEPMRPVYRGSWFVGFVLAGALYLMMTRGRRAAAPR